MRTRQAAAACFELPPAVLVRLAQRRPAAPAHQKSTDRCHVGAVVLVLSL